MMSCDVILLGSMISASIANEHMVHCKMAEAQDSSVGRPRMDSFLFFLKKLDDSGIFFFLGGSGVSSVSLSLAPEVDGPGLFPTRDTASLTALSVLTCQNPSPHTQ